MVCFWLMSPFSDAELRDMQGGSQERQPIPEDRPPVNDGLPHHEFVLSEFAPESGRCDTCGGGPGAPIHSKPVDQMARIADALERIADYLRPCVPVLHDFVPQPINMALCQFCGKTRDDGARHWHTGGI